MKKSTIGVRGYYISLVFSSFLFSAQAATQTKLSASDGASGDYFGYSVAMDGNYTVIGAYYDDDGGSNSGSAYLFELNATDINASQKKLTAIDAAASDKFGSSVATNGNYAVVGAAYDDTQTGSAYLFDITASDINGSQKKLTSSDGATFDYFGWSVATGGNYAVIGAIYADDGVLNSGSAYLFELNATDINASQKKLTAIDAAADDYFGRSVATSTNYAVIGASANDDGGLNSGSAYLFELNATDINASQKKLTASDGAADDQFGFSVATNGKYAVVGAYFDDDEGTNSGSAYLFELNATDINASQKKLTASDGAASDQFGWSVAIKGNLLVVGAYQDDDGGLNSGSIYVFDLTATDINASQVKFTAASPAASDQFGYSVATNGDKVIGGTSNASSYGKAFLIEGISFVDTTAPTFTSAKTDSAGTTITITFSEDLNTSATLSSSSSIYSVSGTSASGWGSPVYSGTKDINITATSGKIYNSETVTLSIATGSGIQDKASNDFNTTSNQAVTNISSNYSFSWSLVTDKWNMVSVPDENKTTEGNIASATNAGTVYKYDNTNGYTKLTTSATTEVNATHGLWIKPTAATVTVPSNSENSITSAEQNATWKALSNNTWYLLGVAQSFGQPSPIESTILKSGCATFSVWDYNTSSARWNIEPTVKVKKSIWYRQNCQ